MTIGLGKRKRRKPEKDKKQQGLHLVIGLLFVIFITIFIHFREVKVDFLEVGSFAKNYVVAQVDFSFPDPDATAILKQEALRDVGKVYKIHNSAIQDVKHRFQQYLISHPDWRTEVHASFDQMWAAINALAETLHEANITDSRTYKKREDTGLSTDNYYIIYPIQVKDSMVLPGAFWKQIEENIHQNFGFSANILSYVIRYFQDQKWSLYSDIEAQRQIRDAIEKEIPKHYTEVKAGSRIIDQGEKVTQRQIAMLSAMKKQISIERNLWQWRTITGSVLFAVIIVVLSGFFLYLFDRAFMQSARKLGLFLTITTFFLIFAKLGEWFFLDRGTLMEMFHYPIFIPLLTMLLIVLIDARLAVFATFVLTILTGVTLAVNHNYYFFMNTVCGITTLVAARDIKKRKEVFFVCFKVWLAALSVIFALNLGSGLLFTRITAYDLIWSIINIVIIAILLIGMIPILESLFGVLTDMVLMEYMDPTNPLLKRLSIEAPGTYQHSLSIGHIAEYVANAIGANGLFCRVTTLYHDIGKLNTPHYYTENQTIDQKGQFNIHELLTPVESAYIIKSHILDGEMLAREYKLPQPFIDIIRQHHGTTLIKFFYLKQVQEMGGREKEVDQNQFRYPGPKPRSKESQLIMLADAVEAMSRTLEDNAEENVRRMVDNLVQDRFTDGQFDESPLTFEELSTVKDKLVEIIRATHHLRIKYPSISK